MMTPAWVGIGVMRGQSSEAGARAFASPKSSTLTVPSAPHLDVRRFQIPVDDALLVRRFDRLGDLPRDRQRLVDRHPVAPEALRQILALDEFHHERGDAVAVLQPVDRADVRMIERGEHRGLALETRATVGVVGERTRQEFDRDLAIQRRVPRAVHLAHAALADRRNDLVDAETGAGDNFHRAKLYPATSASAAAVRRG